MDESTGDFVLPVPRPNISEFYVAPCPPRPLLELLDGWSQRYIADMIDCFAAGMDLLMAVMQEAPEDARDEKLPVRAICKEDLGQLARGKTPQQRRPHLLFGFVLEVFGLARLRTLELQSAASIYFQRLSQ